MMRAKRFPKVLTGLVLLLILVAGLAVPAGAATRVEQAKVPPGLAYVVRYEGQLDPELLDLLHQVSKAEGLRDAPPDSALLLERRAEEDKAAFAKVFQSRGRFAATVTVSLDSAASPAVLTYAIDPGPQFDLRSVILKTPDGGDASALPTAERLGLVVPSPFTAKAILDAEAKITELLRDEARPDVKIDNRQVTANFADHAVSVVWTVSPGPKAAFGPTTFAGLTTVKESYLAGMIPWKQGQPYDAKDVEAYRRALNATGLFAAVQVETGAVDPATGQAPIKASLTERKHRTVKGGVDYKTDEGPGANIGWEHRNLFGGGEKLAVAGSASGIEQFAEAAFEKPDALTPKDLFKAKARVANEDKKAYKGQNATATATLRRQFTDSVSGGAGLGYRASRIEEDESRPWESDARYGFVFLPVEIGYDGRDDVLDPQKGLLATASLAPYWGTLSGADNFLRPEFTLAHYLKILDKPGLVLATRAVGGANIGTDSENVTPDLRWYAGGSGSIRGYSYQSVGPMRGKTPVGGASLFTFSAELRWRVTELVGIVPFLDGGTAFGKALPPYDQPIMLGAGLGLRVYTPVGPIRVDVATPLARRQDIDDIAQFYCSIGQSF